MRYPGFRRLGYVLIFLLLLASFILLEVSQFLWYVIFLLKRLHPGMITPSDIPEATDRSYASAMAPTVSLFVLENTRLCSGTKDL